MIRPSRRGLTAILACAHLLGCGDDAVIRDSGHDAGSTDAGEPDADVDAAFADAGSPEAGLADSGPEDAGGDPDAGRPLALLEPAEGVLHGVGPYDPVEAAYVTALDDPSIEPAVRASFFSIPGVTGRRRLPDAVAAALAQVEGTGRIPQIGLAFHVGSDVATDTEIAAGDHDALIDETAALIRDHGEPLFVRPGFEFNGSWNGYTPGVYVEAFRRVVDRFRAAGADNAAFIWCYEPDAPDDFDGVDARGEPLWYPGDDYVDWFGLDVFQAHHFDPDAPPPGRGSPTPYERADRFLAMARDHGRPVFLAETAAAGVFVTPDADDPGLADGMADWDAWFAPFAAFLDAHSEIKGFIYLDQDFRGTPWDRWGDTRVEANSFILMSWREELRRDRYIHLGDPF